MLYFLTLLAIVSGLIKQKSEFVMICMFLLLWILFGFNTNNADYLIYNLMYDGHYPNHEIGFIFIISLFNKLGFTYQQFLMSISLMSYLFIFSVIRRYSIKTNFIFALYFIFPFMLDIVQIRNFIAMTFIIGGIPYLLSNRKTSTLKYLGVVLVASTFHYTSLFYLVLVLAKSKSWRKLLLLFSIISFISTIIAYTNIIPTMMELIFMSEKVTGWFQERTRLGFIVPLILQIISFGFVYYSYYKYVKNSKISDMNNVIINERYKKVEFNQSKLFELIFRINIVFLIAIPFYIFNVTFFRLYRNILLFNYLIIINGTMYYFKNKYESYIFKILFIMYVFLLLAYFVLQNNLHTVFIEIFESNALF